MKLEIVARIDTYADEFDVAEISDRLRTVRLRSKNPTEGLCEEFCCQVPNKCWSPLVSLNKVELVVRILE